MSIDFSKLKKGDKLITTSDFNNLDKGSEVAFLGQDFTSYKISGSGAVIFEYNGKYGYDFPEHFSLPVVNPVYFNLPNDKQSVNVLNSDVALPLGFTQVNVKIKEKLSLVQVVTIQEAYKYAISEGLTKAILSEPSITQGVNGVEITFDIDTKGVIRSEPDVVLTFKLANHYSVYGSPKRVSNRAGSNTQGTSKVKGIGTSYEGLDVEVFLVYPEGTFKGGNIVSKRKEKPGDKYVFGKTELKTGDILLATFNFGTQTYTYQNNINDIEGRFLDINGVEVSLDLDGYTLDHSAYFSPAS